MSGRRLGCIKGPLFPSFQNQNTDPKKIMVWKPGTQSTRQQKKNLRNKARVIIDSKDPQIIATGDRVIRSVCAEPDPEYSALHLFCAAMDLSDDCGESWVTCMNHLMDTFEGKTLTAADEAQRKEIEDGKRQSGTTRGSFLRGLLRTLVPRAIRQSHEVAASPHVDQQPGAGDTQHAASNGSNPAGDVDPRD